MKRWFLLMLSFALISGCLASPEEVGEEAEEVEVGVLAEALTHDGRCDVFGDSDSPFKKCERSYGSSPSDSGRGEYEFAYTSGTPLTVKNVVAAGSRGRDIRFYVTGLIECTSDSSVDRHVDLNQFVRANSSFRVNLNGYCAFDEQPTWMYLWIDQDSYGR
jgi:hypothetical protein